MKKRYSLIFIFLFLLITNIVLKVLSDYKFVNDYYKVYDKDLDTYEIEEITQRVNFILREIRNDDYYNFLEHKNFNFIVAFFDKLIQKKIIKERNIFFGKYQGLMFDSLYLSKSCNEYYFKILRFKGVYDSKKNIEIRVVLNYQNDIEKLLVKSWKEDLFSHHRLKK